MSGYYEDKVFLLREVFGADEVTVMPDALMVDGRLLPVVDDVIVALEPGRIPEATRRRISAQTGTADGAGPSTPFAAEVQYSFGQEWSTYSEVLQEHAVGFDSYFDLVDLRGLADLRVADLGCGMGRWAHFMAGLCRDLVLVDFSEAIFVARKNLRHADNTVFVMADLLDLPFADGSFDLVYCLGVLHHLPVDALEAMRRLRPLAPRHLAYLYYALDNRPAYFRWTLSGVTLVRRTLSRVRSPAVRSVVTWAIALGVYAPLAALGSAVRPLGLGRFVPLGETYAGKSLTGLRQDAYDRFFTSIEQRFTRADILTLTDSFTTVTVSDHLPYWHFLCKNDDDRYRTDRVVK